MRLGYRTSKATPEIVPSQALASAQGESEAMWGNAALAETLPSQGQSDGMDWLSTGQEENTTPGTDDFSWASDVGPGEAEQRSDGLPSTTGETAPGVRTTPETLLETSLTAALAKGTDFASLEHMVACAPLQERQLAYRSQALHQAIAKSTLTPPEQLALATSLAEGSLRWDKPLFTRSDFYMYFIVNHAEGPPPELQDMNCWELILYSAWKLGQISTAWIQTRYAKPKGEIDNPSWSELGFSANLPLADPSTGAAASAGELVFISHRAVYETSGPPTEADLQQEPWHVVLSLGGDVAMSLWQRPTRDTPTSRVTLSSYAARNEILRKGAAPWHA